MRRCHSDAMGDYRRKDNQDMWDRPVTDPVEVPSPGEQAERDKSLREHNLRSKLLRAVYDYLTEIEIGE